MRIATHVRQKSRAEQQHHHHHADARVPTQTVVRPTVGAGVGVVIVIVGHPFTITPACMDGFGLCVGLLGRLLPLPDRSRRRASICIGV